MYSARRAVGIALAAMTAAAMAGAVPVATAATTPSDVNVTVNANEGLGTIPDTGYGLNSAVWDGQMNTPQVQGLLSTAGVRMLRYPGGSYGDIYHWQDNTATGGFVAPGTDFDSFMGTVRTIGAQPMLIANYGSGSPQEAADWVRYANVTKGYGAKYWEIGNELYGNGYYGADWETDDHADHSPTAYADNVLSYVDAMKAVDPTIKVGAVLTLPGNWPDSVVNAGDAGDWNKTVLSLAGSAIDFVIVHWYPSATDAATELTEPSMVAGELAQLRQEIDQYAGPNGPHIGIAMTEMNGGVDEDTQPDALFSADAYFTALEHGVFTVDWWDTHNGGTAVGTAPDGATDFDDFGVLSSGSTVGTTAEPPMNTPFPSYFALAMLGRVGRPGDTMVRAGSDSSMVAVHAVRNANGDLSVLLVNKDPANAHQVALHYAGFTPSTATPTVYGYGDEATTITTDETGTSATRTLPAYSIETVVLTPTGTASTVGAPTGASVTGVTGDQATVTWTPGTGTAVRYEVYRQFGTDSELLGSSTTDSLTLHNLPPGTGYTLNVLARDGNGNLSAPSNPVTFTSSTPRAATCAVNYVVTTGWGTGYNTDITVTDTGPNSINGWTLAFSFPTDSESVSGGWNGNWTTDGANVHVTNLDWNATLAPNGGNSVDIGFTGANNGAYPSPASFTLNGTVCATTYSS
ncbi:MAG TPA: cellulose binding domain-containing protein [Pseudonocardiaceae bacterium]|nr:cellulose binding domain-containing protein [Pseudonocardiaceae bacterium]